MVFMLLWWRQRLSFIRIPLVYDNFPGVQPSGPRLYPDIVDDRDYHGSGHLLQVEGSVLVLEPHPPHVHLHKVNEGELHQGHKDESKAEDDVDVQRSGVGDPHLLLLPDEADRDDSCKTENR